MSAIGEQRLYCSNGISGMTLEDLSQLKSCVISVSWESDLWT
jgi:hypothetical protein